MPELLLHFAISFSLAALVLGLKKGLLVGLVGILPDLDALARVHRSFTHSLVLLGLIATMFIFLSITLKRVSGLAVASGLSLLSHPVLDLFQSPTPILYPFSEYSYHASVAMNALISDKIVLKISADLISTQSVFTQFNILDGPIFTDVGFIVSFILITFPLIYYLTRATKPRDSTYKNDKESYHIAVISAYPPDRGRLSEYCYALVNALTKRGVRILVGSDLQSQPSSSANVRVKALWRPDNPLTLLRLPSFILKHRVSILLFNIHFAVFGRTRFSNFLGILMVALTSMMAKLLRVRSAVILHNLPSLIRTSHFGLEKNFVNRLGFMLAERLVVCGKVLTTVRLYKKYLELRYIKRVGYLPHGCWYRNGYDPSPDQKWHLLFFGYLSPAKDMEMLARVFGKLVIKFPQLKLRLACSAHPNFPEASAQLNVFKSLPNVEYVGYVEEEKLGEVFDGCLAVILPYRTATGTSGVAHVAMSYGVPIIATDLPEFRELYRSGCGLMLCTSEEEMVACVEKLINDRQLWYHLSKKNLDYSKRFSWDRIADILLKELLSNA
ncbi:MAG: glycosyltransferase [Nitrososphaerota archaeon]|nr:glycosyltransferase [Thermoproteota archaeon]